METQKTSDGKGFEGPWTEHEKSPGTMQNFSFTLKEFWEIFVDDRPIGADTMFKHVNVRSKAVFSCGMMDKMNGWEDEGRWVGSTTHARNPEKENT